MMFQLTEEQLMIQKAAEKNISNSASPATSNSSYESAEK